MGAEAAEAVEEPPFERIASVASLTVAVMASPMAFTASDNSCFACSSLSVAPTADTPRESSSNSSFIACFSSRSASSASDFVVDPVCW